jgi:hypothetical protein
MALQAALNKSKAQPPPQGKPLTPRAQYTDGSDAGNSLQRPGTSSLRSAGGGRDGRSLSVRITAPTPAVTRPFTGGTNDMRAMVSGGSGSSPLPPPTRAPTLRFALSLTCVCAGGLASILGNAMNRCGPHTRHTSRTRVTCDTGALARRRSWSTRATSGWTPSPTSTCCGSQVTCGSKPLAARAALVLTHTPP